MKWVNATFQQKILISLISLLLILIIFFCNSEKPPLQNREITFAKSFWSFNPLTPGVH